MANFLFRLWVHEAEDGLVPEVAVDAETKIQAAALALRHFVAIGRPISGSAYLECGDDTDGFRVRDVLGALRVRREAEAARRETFIPRARSVGYFSTDWVDVPDTSSPVKSWEQSGEH